MDEDGQSDLLRRLFLLIGLEAEELGEIALDGQAGEIAPVRHHELALRARDLGEKLLIVADAAAALSREAVAG